jgi:hypothetical protein
MIKLTVQQYANKCNTSVQQVYRQIKKGSLTTVKESGKTLIMTDNNDVKQNDNNIIIKDKHTLEDFLIKENKKLNKEIQRLNKIINKLNKKVDKSVVSEKQTLLTYISELKHLQLENKPKENIEVVKTKKRKSKKKAKK